MKISPVIIFFLFSMLILLAAMHVRAQTANWEWARCGNGYGEGTSVTTDNFGNIYLAGEFGDSISFGSIKLIGSPSSYNTFLVKYDELGNVLWAKGSSGQAITFTQGIASDGTGNVYLTGYFMQSSISFGIFTLASPESYDGFLVKYDSNGNVIWARSIGGDGDDFCSGIATDNSGNALICGSFSSHLLVLDNDTLIASMGLGSEAFVAKFDANGNTVWAKSSVAFGDGVNYSASVTTDFFDNVYVTGAFSSTHVSFGSYTLFNSPFLGYDVFLVKYDSIGNVKWLKGASGIGDDRGRSVATSTNKIYLTGDFNSQQLILISDTLNYLGPSAVFFAQLDSNGNVDWAKSTSGTGLVSAYSISTDSLGNLYSSGSLSFGDVTFDAITLENPNGPDPMYIVQYNSNGQATFATSLTSGGDDWNSIAVTTINTIYVGGDFYGDNLIVGADTLALTGDETPFLAKLNIKSLDGIVDINKESCCIFYPNPLSDILNISIKDDRPSQVVLYDLSSRRLLQQDFVTFTSLNLGQLSNGFYICEVIFADGKIIRRKVVKQ